MYSNEKLKQYKGYFASLFFAYKVNLPCWRGIQFGINNTRGIFSARFAPQNKLSDLFEQFTKYVTKLHPLYKLWYIWRILLAYQIGNLART